ncbi:hypothetical protein PFISCL1PPCAC_4876, partial [Pristionchus fissidentatus]
RYAVNSTYSTSQIACRDCDIPDGQMPQDNPNIPERAISTKCVATCPPGFELSYYGGVAQGGYYVRRFSGGGSAFWYDPMSGVDIIATY